MNRVRLPLVSLWAICVVAHHIPVNAAEKLPDCLSLARKILGKDAIEDWDKCSQTIRLSSAQSNGWFHSDGPLSLVGPGVFTGEFRKGKRHSGTFIFDNGDIYAGEFGSGGINGIGIVKKANGDRFEGQFRESQASGRGIYMWANGDTWVGNWTRGRRDGYGELKKIGGTVIRATWNGDETVGVAEIDNEKGKYSGGVAKEVPHGSGKFEYSDGSTYDGQWIDGVYDGDGVFTSSGGQQYVGKFARGKREGAGSVRWPEGWVWVGRWKDDKAVGVGEYIKPRSFSIGSAMAPRYTGEFRDGNYSGTLALYSADGTVVKEMSGSLRSLEGLSGRGVLQWPSGEKYEGSFKDGLFDGEGRYTLPKRVYEGVWSQGELNGSGALKANDQYLVEYTGNFVNGRLEGYGVGKFSDGNKYEGYWKNSKKEGKGKLWTSAGEIYTGSFVHDQLDGVVELLLGKDVVTAGQAGEIRYRREVGNFKANSRNGVFKQYDIGNKLVRTVEYQGNRLVRVIPFGSFPYLAVIECGGLNGFFGVHVTICLLPSYGAPRAIVAVDQLGKLMRYDFNQYVQPIYLVEKFGWWEDPIGLNIPLAGNFELRTANFSDYNVMRVTLKDAKSGKVIEQRVIPPRSRSIVTIRR